MSQQQAQQPQQFPPQQQPEPGKSQDMTPKPDTEPRFKGADKLKGKVAIISGGDSGIGRAVAQAFAREGANIAIIYRQSHEDADEAKRLVEKEGTKCITIVGDVGDEEFCKKAVEQTITEFGKLDVLVNNAGEQHPQKSLEDISAEQLQETFQTNIFGMMFLSKAALPHLKPGSSIINTTSVTAFKGSGHLLDYSSTKGAIVAFTRSLALNLAEKQIRVNGVAPGPIWTPLIPSTFPPEKVEKFGSNTALKRAGQPNEVSPSYVLLASEDGSFITGQILHVDGGQDTN